MQRRDVSTELTIRPSGFCSDRLKQAVSQKSLRGPNRDESAAPPGKDMPFLQQNGETGWDDIRATHRRAVVLPENRGIGCDAHWRKVGT